MYNKILNVLIGILILTCILLVTFLNQFYIKENDLPSSPTEPKTYHTYGYEFLDQKQQEIYDFLEKRELSLNEEIQLDKYYEYDYLNKVLDLYRTSNSELCNDYCYAPVLEYTEMWNEKEPPSNKIKAVRVLYPIPDYEKKQIELEGVAQTIINDMPKDLNQIEQLKYLHDYIIDNVDYAENDLQYNLSAFGALLQKQAICEGYAKAFEYLVKKIEIPVITIIGKANEESHAWNMVQIDNYWYHVDTTWDDTETEIFQHKYFLLSDDELNQKRVNIIDPFSYNIPVPKATHSLQNKIKELIKP